jgi:hypothetical protein
MGRQTAYISDKRLLLAMFRVGKPCNDLPSVLTDSVSHRRTICLCDSFPLAIGKVYIVATIIKAIDFTSFVLEEIVDFVSDIILSILVYQRFARSAGAAQNSQQRR